MAQGPTLARRLVAWRLLHLGSRRAKLRRSAQRCSGAQVQAATQVRAERVI